MVLWRRGDSLGQLDRLRGQPVALLGAEKGCGGRGRCAVRQCTAAHMATQVAGVAGSIGAVRAGVGPAGCVCAPVARTVAGAGEDATTVRAGKR